MRRCSMRSSQLLAGRFSRARKAAQAALAQERTLAALDARLPQAQQVRVLAHLLAAESAQSLQDRPARDAHLQQALNESAERGPRLAPGNARRRAAARGPLGAARIATRRPRWRGSRNCRRARSAARWRCGCA